MVAPISFKNPQIQERDARRVNFFQTGQLPPLVGGNQSSGGIGAINHELTPNLQSEGSSYTNGLGHSQHTKNWMF